MSWSHHYASGDLLAEKCHTHEDTQRRPGLGLCASHCGGLLSNTHESWGKEDSYRKSNAWIFYWLVKRSVKWNANVLWFGINGWCYIFLLQTDRKRASGVLLGVSPSVRVSNIILSATQEPWILRDEDSVSLPHHWRLWWLTLAQTCDDLTPKNAWHLVIQEIILDKTDSWQAWVKESSQKKVSFHNSPYLVWCSRNSLWLTVHNLFISINYLTWHMGLKAKK